MDIVTSELETFGWAGKSENNQANSRQGFGKIGKASFSENADCVGNNNATMRMVASVTNKSMDTTNLLIFLFAASLPTIYVLTLRHFLKDA